MKKYVDENGTKIVYAYEEDGKYILDIKTYTAHICATRKRGVYSTEYWWTNTKKEFTSKESANKYFLAIKRNNPTLKRVG